MFRNATSDVRSEIEKEILDALNDLRYRMDKLEAEYKDDWDRTIEDFLLRADLSDPLSPAKPKDERPNFSCDSCYPSACTMQHER